MDNLQQLETEAAIRNLIARLARLADSGDIDEYLTVFTDDAVMETPAGRREGRDGLRAGAEAGRAAGATGPGTRTLHQLGATEVVVDGEEVRAFTPFVFFKNTDAGPAVATIGRYRDTFRQTAEGWKLAHRSIESI